MVARGVSQRRAHPYLVGLIGAGVGPSLTPLLHMVEAGALGLTYVYRTIELAASDGSSAELGRLVAAARAFGFNALNITHPGKQLVISHLDRLDGTAARIGAVNTVIFEEGAAVGHNTDLSGFAAAFRRGLPGLVRRHVVLLGAGGGGAAVADALLSEGVEHLSVVDVDEKRGEDLRAALAARFPEQQVAAGDPDRLSVLLPGSDGLVHCTPTGMVNHPGLPLDPALLHPELWVVDIVYRPLDTPLLRAAREAGCRTLHGGHMAVHQAAGTLRLVTGLEPNVDRMLRHFETLVADEAAGLT